MALKPDMIRLLFHFGTTPSRIGSTDGLARSVDFSPAWPNNFPMGRPETVRRIKSYSAATGYVYQYYFREVRPARRGFASGNEYVYMISADRKATFPLGVFVRRDAVRAWAKKVGRELTGTEEYAVAKMRLFQAFDESQELPTNRPDLQVDESNLESLLAQLDL